MADAKTAQRLLEAPDGDARIDQRAEQHVARGPGKTLEIHDTRHQSTLDSLIEQYSASASTR